MADDVVEPLRNCSFQILIDNVQEGHFFHCSGLNVSIEDIAYREAGGPEYAHRLPGLVTYEPMQLKWGVCESRELWDWFQATVDRKVDRRTVHVLALRQDQSEAFRWTLYGAWIRRWISEPLDALGKEVAVHAIELAFERAERG